MNKRILFVDEDQEHNGSTVSLEYIVRGFKDAGYDTVVLTWKQEEWTKTVLKSCAMVLDGRWGPVTTLTMCVHFTYTASPFSPEGIKNILKDVVKFVVGFVLMVRVIRKVRPAILYCNEYSVVQASVAARVCGVPSVMHIRSQMLTGLFGLRRYLMRRLVVRSNAAVFAITPCEAEQLQPRSDEREKISVVGEFFPSLRSDRADSVSALRIGLGIPADRVVVAMLGGLVAIKGAREFLEAGERILARHPRAFLVLAGGARIGGDPRKQSYVDDCMKLVKKLESEGNLKFLGEMPDALDLIAASDILVSPSLQSHFSRPVIEAWGYGKPVVAFRSPHMEALVADGVDGLLAECGDVRGLADAVVHLLEDAAGSRAMGLAGKKKTESEFNAQKNLETLIARCNALCRAS